MVDLWLMMGRFIMLHSGPWLIMAVTLVQTHHCSTASPGPSNVYSGDSPRIWMAQPVSTRKPPIGSRYVESLGGTGGWHRWWHRWWHRGPGAPAVEVVAMTGVSSMVGVISEGYTVVIFTISDHRPLFLGSFVSRVDMNNQGGNDIVTTGVSLTNH